MEFSSDEHVWSSPNRSSFDSPTCQYNPSFVYYHDSSASSACEYNPSFAFHPDSSFYLSDSYPPQGTGLYELFDNSSPKPDNDSRTSLASDEHVWSSPNRSSDSPTCQYNPSFAYYHDSSASSACEYNPSFAFHPDSSFYLSDFYPPQGTGLYELFDNSSPKADEDVTALASDEHVGGSSVNISDAGIMSKRPADGGLNKPFGGGAQFSGGSQEGYCARDSCRSACYTCGEAEHFATRCSLGLDGDCGRSDRHSSRDSTTSYII